MTKTTIHLIDRSGRIYSEAESKARFREDLFVTSVYRFFDIWGLSAKMPASYLKRTTSLPPGIACDGEYVYVFDREGFEENMLSNGVRPLPEKAKVICRERATEKFF